MMTIFTDFIAFLVAHDIQHTCLNHMMEMHEDVVSVISVHIPDQAHLPYCLSYPQMTGITVWLFNYHTGNLIGIQACDKRAEILDEQQRKEMGQWNPHNEAGIFDPWKEEKEGGENE